MFLRSLLGLVMVATLAPTVLVAADHPVTLLRAGELELRVHSFDPVDGYYRGLRFDHGGIVAQATWHGHTVFGELREPRKPEGHDHVAGVAEEFGIDGALGYTEADPAGGTFVKVGVGVLARDNDKPYAFSRLYPVAELPPWTVVADTTSITSTQTLTHGEWGYVFTKTIRVAEDGNAFTVRHELENTGTKPIVTDHYSHNNLCFDGDPIGSAYRLVYPAPIIKEEGRGPGVIEGDTFTLAEPLKKSLWFRLGGIPVDDNRVRVEHSGSNIALTISHDYAPAKVVVYGESRAICPEHFVAIDLEPGATQTWTTTYTFSR